MKALQIIFVLLISLLIISCGGEKPSEKVSTKEVKSAKKETKVDEVETKKTTDEKAEVNKEAEEEKEVEVEPIPKEQLDKAKKIIKSVGDVSKIDAKKIFKINCTICHGLKGNMKINGAKDLTKSKINLTNAVAQVYFGKGLMTPYSNILSDEEIVAVAKYSEKLRK